MNKINLKKIILGGLIAGLTLLILEGILEYLIWGNIPGIGSEQGRWQSLFPTLSRENWGIGNHLLNLFFPFGSGILLVWVYTILKPMYGAGNKAAIITGIIFWLFWLLLVAWFTNAGIFPIKLSIISLVNNFVELPLMVIVGARIYERGMESS